VLEKGEEEAQTYEGVTEKKINEYTHENLLKDVRLSEPSDFQNFLRLDATSFDELLKMITPRSEPFISFSPFLKLVCKELFFFNQLIFISIRKYLSIFA